MSGEYWNVISRWKPTMSKHEHEILCYRSTARYILCNKSLWFCQWLAADQWFSWHALLSAINETDRDNTTDIQSRSPIKWVSDMRVNASYITADSGICQLYHGENKLIVNEMMMRSTLY